MPIVRFKHRGNFDKTEHFLKHNEKLDFIHLLESYALQGVVALTESTPVDTGKTANSWGYKIENDDGVARITWTNDNINHGVPIAIIIQYGHATGTGGFVQGRDYINPAMQPLFDRMADEIWREVTRN